MTLAYFCKQGRCFKGAVATAHAPELDLRRAKPTRTSRRVPILGVLATLSSVVHGRHLVEDFAGRLWAYKALLNKFRFFKSPATRLNIS